MNKLSSFFLAFFLLILSSDVHAQLEYSNLLGYKMNIDNNSTYSKVQFKTNTFPKSTRQSLGEHLEAQAETKFKFSLKKNNQLFSNNQLQTPIKNSIMSPSRRLKYSSLWAFTSLNYLYADLVGLMDLNLLSQYQTGVVNGVEITPIFLTAAAAYMQIPLANVFLPHVIKNDRALRIVQIISGSIATLAQGATLFVGKPAPYYVLFSIVEMGATAYITYDAIKWKTKKNPKKKPIAFY